MVKINSGAPDPTDRFENTPKAKWNSLLNAKRSFIATNLDYDCRCLIEFCEEAELVYSELGFKSAAEMIREGYDLEPSKVELALAWLKANGTGKPIGIGEIKEKIAEAKDNPLLPPDFKEGRPPKDNPKSVDNINTSKGGTDTKYTLRRLARDAPEMLDRIEAGELSVNAAAIQAGIRKKPTAYEIALKAVSKLSSDEWNKLKEAIDGW